MLEELSGVFGWMIVILYALAFMNYIVKYINKNFGQKIRENKNVDKYYKKFMKFIIKYHKVFGIVVFIAILIHFIGEFSRRGLSISGIVATGFMILLVLMGIYGAYVSNKRNKPWFYLHKGIAIIVAVTIVIHLVVKA